MSAILSLLALAAGASDQPRLDPAQPVDLVPAVQSCTRAVVGNAKVDHSALEADGWKQDEVKGIWVVRRKLGNSAIIVANNGQSSEFPGNFVQEVCMVRARLSSSVAPSAVAEEVTSLTDIRPIVSQRKRDKWFWRGASVWVGQEAMDPAPDGSPIIQLAVMPAPQPWQRPTPDASSQNKNQEPR